MREGGILHKFSVHGDRGGILYKSEGLFCVGMSGKKAASLYSSSTIIKFVPDEDVDHIISVSAYLSRAV